MLAFISAQMPSIRSSAAAGSMLVDHAGPVDGGFCGWSGLVTKRSLHAYKRGQQKASKVQSCTILHGSGAVLNWSGGLKQDQCHTDLDASSSAAGQLREQPLATLVYYSDTNSVTQRCLNHGQAVQRWHVTC